MQLYDKTFSTLAYPFCLLVCLCAVSSFGDDYQYVDVSRCENSSWSSGWWELRCV